MTTRVVLVRPWTDVRGGGGCCGGHVEGGVCLEREQGAAERPPELALLAETYRRLRQDLPLLDVQVVSAGNLAYLVPASFVAVRRRRGVLAGLAAASQATTAGAVLVDGARVGDLAELGAEGVVSAVVAEIASRPPPTSLAASPRGSSRA